MTDVTYPKGTKIRALESSGRCYTEGTIYELREDFCGDPATYKAFLTVKDDMGSTTNGFGAKFFEVVVPPLSRAFDTGATRDNDEGKLDFEGFLSPLVLKRYAEHMHAARKMPDGTMRASDNWQLGIPLDVYMKSMWRHFFAVWESHRRGTDTPEADLAALLFNVSGYLHEALKAKKND